MSAGVRHTVANVVVRQVEVATVAAKCELQDAHSGKAKFISQRFNVRRDDAEIFGDDRQITKSNPKSIEEVAAGNFHPTPALSRRVTGRNLPACGESPKVI